MSKKPTNKKLLGVILVGGRSTRMGRDKAALPHQAGGTYLSHAIDLLSQQCDEVVVSGTTSAKHSIKTLEDSVSHRGPATGIATALQYCQFNASDACFVLPVDTPFLTSIELAKIKLHWITNNQITLAFSDQLQPLIGVYPVAFAQRVQQLADSQDCGLTRWFSSQEHVTVSLPPERCRNINTPEDLSHGS